MRNTRLFFLVLTLAAMTVAGCDQQAAQYAAAQQKLDDALAIMAVAQQGYAPLDAKGQRQNLQAFRQEQLGDARTHLREVVSSGSPQQQVMARRLLAATQLSAARYAVRDAMAQFAALSARTPVLVGTLQATERAFAQATREDVDYDAALGRIAADAKGFVDRRAKLLQRSKNLKKRLVGWEAKRDAESTKTAAAMAQARTALDKTFVAEGDDRMTHQDQADAAERRAAVASAEAEKHQIQIDLIHNRLLIVTVQHETLASQILDLKQQAEQTLELQATTAQATAQARLDQDAAAHQLKAEFDSLTTVYRESIRQPLAGAAELAEEAAGQLLSGIGGADRLSAYVDQAYINTKRAIAAAGWANIILMPLAVAEVASLSDADAYRTQWQQAQADYDEAEQTARAAITAGHKLAESLNTVYTALADQQAQRLSDFERQLAQNAIQ